MSTQKSEGSENAPNAPYIAKRNLAARTGPNAKVKPHVNEQEYAAMYKESIEQPDKFWDKVSCLFCVCGVRLLTWDGIDGQRDFVLDKALRDCQAWLVHQW